MKITFKNTFRPPVAFGSLCTIPHLLSFVDPTACLYHQLPVSDFSVVHRRSALTGALLTVANSPVRLALRRHATEMESMTSFFV